MQANVHRYHDENHSGSVLLDDGREIPFDGKVFDASGLRRCAPASGSASRCPTQS
jgi:2-phospho-L-lactate guanylyltransferase